jgi:hypothetical protein
MKKNNYFLIFCIVALAIETLWILSKQLPSIQWSPPSRNDGFLCLLMGEIFEAKDAKKVAQNNFEALARMVHMRFDVSNLSECRNTVTSYCEKSVSEGYVAKNLVLVFSDPSNFKVTRRVNLDSQCNLLDH